MEKNRVVAMLLAGGQGTRVLPTRPKQFIEVRGESILLHTMRAFETHPLVTDIIVVCGREWANYVRSQAEVGHITKLSLLAEAGETSYASLCNGIATLQQEGFEDETMVLVHDSVRPFVSFEIISRNIATCQQKGNAVTGLKSNEAYLKLEKDSLQDGHDSAASTEYIPREDLVRAQTPITFPLSNLTEMVDLANENGITDSQSLITLVNQLHYSRLHIVEGDALNFKITLPSDVELYRRLCAY